MFGLWKVIRFLHENGWQKIVPITQNNMKNIRNDIVTIKVIYIYMHFTYMCFKMIFLSHMFCFVSYLHNNSNDTLTWQLFANITINY